MTKSACILVSQIHVFWYLKSVRGLFFIKWPYMTKSACILVSQISPWSLLYKMTIYDKIRMYFGISNQSVVSSWQNHVRGLFFIKWPYMTKSACILVSQISTWSLLYKMTIYDKIRMYFGISNQSVVSSL